MDIALTLLRLLMQTLIRSSYSMGELTISSQFVFVFFFGQTSYQGKGFRLDVRDSGTSASQKRVTFFRKDESFSTHYPLPPLSGYKSHEAVFILGAPPVQKATINVDIMDNNTV